MRSRRDTTTPRALHGYESQIDFSIAFHDRRENMLTIALLTSSHGVTVSTLDSESSDGGSNPPGSF